MTKIAINGLGRIGRASLKMLIQNPELELVAVNDLVPPYHLAYLLNFDTVYGKMQNRVSFDEFNLYVNGRTIRVFNEPDAERLPWGQMGIELVLECTGKFTRRQELEKHLRAGAQRVILSAPSKSEDVPTIVPGVNEIENPNETIVSCASCTTNAIAPVLEVLSRRIGVRKSLMTTLHAYTASQSLVDEPGKDMRAGRAAALNFIPTTTGASAATTKVLPQLQNRVNGLAIRGPVPTGSIADITILTERPTSVEEINNIFSQEAGSDRYVGILGVNVEPIVSSDIIMDPRASVVDLAMTQVVDGDLVKILAWYDNEWGYANQLIKAAERMARIKRSQQQNEMAAI
ncbi:MAG: type I glyceraldehyde-3-phosphate dehydrogenase [Cytophagaceae bacterium]